MALLSTCWFIIEYILIPDGFAKWICLSFFIHPFLLFFCQIYLWLISLGCGILVVLFYPLRFLWFVTLLVFKFLKKHVICFFSSAELPANFEASQDITICEVIEESHYSVQAIVLYNSYCVSVSQSLEETVEGSEVFKETYYIKELVINDTDDTTESVMSEFHKDMDLDDEDSSSSSLLHNSNYTAESDVGLDDEDLSSSSQLHNEDSIFDYESPVLERETNGHGEHTELVDPFYEEYAQRMKWFDLLNYERTCGMGAIFNSQLESHLIEPIEPTNLFLPYMALSKVSRRKMLRSLESDFELVYVGQTCLCWEALHHQYLKIEALANSGSKKGVFYDNVAGNFQKFQVLLERFMEDERTKGKRYWNYVQGRFPLKSLLQVPEISGYYEEEQEGLTGQCTKIRDVLKAIEKSINALWVFLKTDNSGSWWKLGKIVWTFQPVEDPKDLKLLADLKKGLQRKQLLMKDLQKKKKCWLKRGEHDHELQRREVLFSMIDIKLVSRVLKMSIISASQLNWCQQRLANIQFVEGRVTRTSSDFQFPT